MAYKNHRFDNSDLRLILRKYLLYKPSFFPEYLQDEVPEKDGALFPLTLTKSVEIFMHWHETPELIYVTEGSLSVKIDRSTLVVEEGNIAVIDSNQMHYLLPETPQCTFYSLIPNVTRDSENSPLPPKSNDSNILYLYRSIIKEYTTRDKNYKKIINSYIDCIFALLSRLSDDKEETEGAPSAKLIAVRNAIKYISENFKNDISIDDIAANANLSRYYLCHVFKEITGQTVIDHLSYVRCNYARSLLSSGNYTVSQSALMAGFNNLSYFSKIYREKIGNLPSMDKK